MHVRFMSLARGLIDDDDDGAVPMLQLGDWFAEVASAGWRLCCFLLVLAVLYVKFEAHLTLTVLRRYQGYKIAFLLVQNRLYVAPAV